MNRAWLTSLTLAGVVGTSGAAMAGVNASPSTSASPSVSTSLPPTSSETAGAMRTVTYQIGEAGNVTVVFGQSGATISDAIASPGWTSGTTVGVGTHVEVEFVGPLGVVTFSADLVNGELFVSVARTEPDGSAAAGTIVPVVVTTPDTGSVAPQPAVVSNPPTSTSNTATTKQPATTSSSGSSHDDDEADDVEDHDDQDHDDLDDDGAGHEDGHDDD